MGHVKRAYERLSYLSDVTVTALPGGKPLDARTIDISLGGVGILTSSYFERGQLIALSFRFFDSRRGVFWERVTGKVAYFRAEADTNRIGVEFVEPLNEAANPELTKRILRL